MTAVRIVIFAKAPRPGFAKTRLTPALGAEGAAELARRLLFHTVHAALEADVGPVELCVTPDVDATVWESYDMDARLQWSSQGDGDLGDRLARSAARSLLLGEPVLLIGTDCPQLDAATLRQAALALHRHDAVLYPATDGGYVLLGLKRFDAGVFEGIAWSTNTVADRTLAKLGALGWNVASGDALHDIDEPADLRWLPAVLHVKAG